MERITSRHNSLVQHVKKIASSRKYRREAGEFLCEGPKLWEEAVRWNWPISTVFVSDETQLEQVARTTARVVQVSGELLAYMADTESPQGLLFTCALPEQELPRPLPGERFLVLDGVQDPGNVGTIWRTADAFGADGLILLPGCADPFAPKTVRATMGACFRLRVWHCELPALLGALAEKHVPLYATALRSDTMDIREADLKRSAVVVGSEGRGVSRPVLDACAATLKIPMTQRCESLNAAIAAGIVLWESWR